MLFWLKGICLKFKIIIFELFGATLFFQSIHMKANATVTAFENTLIVYQCPFTSRDNVYVNLDYWISLHPKKAILYVFQDKHSIFLVKMKTKIN